MGYAAAGLALVVDLIAAVGVLTSEECQSVVVVGVVAGEVVLVAAGAAAVVETAQLEPVAERLVEESWQGKRSWHAMGYWG